MPSPVEALPCGSRSISSTRSPTAARAVPRLMAVVVLPTPPFWLDTDKHRRADSDMFKLPHPDDAAVGRAAAVDQFRLKTPRFGGRFQLGHNILTLHEQPDRAPPQVGPSIAEKFGHGSAGARGDHIDADIQIFGSCVVHH